ncbi:MAG: hypothetical protein CFE33_19910 [Pseudorhodobacter sp. PARRP1]|nr:MAG: hypothetical protein CFE33_19910 [Pseudorhodobacter sp. PARRP1]
MKDTPFTADRLLALYDRVAEAEDAIPLLSQTILNLAVRGKLVEQDADDEPAEKVLKSISKEIGIKRKKMGLRPNLTLPSVDESDTPFGLPSGWAWARFPEVGVFARGKSKHRPRNDPHLYANGTVPFVQTGDVARSGGIISSHSAVYNETGLRQSMLWPAGTMCITIAANIADSGILTFDACFPDSVVGLVAASHFGNARYFEYFVRTAKANLTEFAPATAQKNINLGILEMVLIPLPPLAEQQRIVAKVDDLMALCDQLEQARAGREAVRDRLTAATWARLTAPETDAETFPTHARTALHTLPTLTTRAGQIKTLRQTILNLAVGGKLVEQDAADEPAAVLIGRLRSSRAELEQQKLILKPTKPKGVEDAPFVLPTSWLWSRLVEVCDVVDPNPSHRMPEYVAQNGYPLVSSQNFAENDQIDYSIGKKVSLSTVEEQAERFSILPGSFLFSRIGTIGKTRPLKAERSYAISHACCVINPVSAEDLSMRFLRLALSAETILMQAHHGVQSVGVPDLGMGVMRAMQIPLPPLAEQHRIVAKVDALMALCNQLESSLTTATTTRSRLLEHLLHEALNGALGGLPEIAA